MDFLKSIDENLIEKILQTLAWKFQRTPDLYRSGSFPLIFMSSWPKQISSAAFVRVSNLKVVFDKK
jgi:hypothetical protein